MGTLQVLAAAMSAGERRRKDAAQGQGGLFDAHADETSVQHPPVPSDEFEREALLRFEKEALGLYVSSHPLQGLRDQLRDEVDVPVGQLGDSLDGSVLWTGGIISNLQRKATKSGGMMLVFRLEDVDGGCEAVAFASVCEQHKDLLVEDNIIKIKGRLDRKSKDDVKLIVMEVRPFGGVSESRPLTVTVDAAQLQPGLLDDLKQISPISPARCRSCCRW